MTEPVLAVNDVSKRFADHRVLDGVSFALNPGEIVGFVGSNGAGKTTTMRIVMGLLDADGGEVRWQGKAIDGLSRRAFGYMPEERGLYPKQTVSDQLRYLATLHGLQPDRAKAAVEQMLSSLGLSERSKDKLQTLSLGNQQRVQIAAALVHDPTMLILDEPFNGLDPVAVNFMSKILRKRAEHGVPVLFSSHQLDLVDKLCDRLLILNKGTIIADGTPEQLRRQRPLRYRLVVAPNVNLDWLPSIPGVHLELFTGTEGPSTGAASPVTLATDRCRVFTVQDEQVIQVVLREAMSRGEVHECARADYSLSEIFLEAAV